MKNYAASASSKTLAAPAISATCSRASRRGRCSKLMARQTADHLDRAEGSGSFEVFFHAEHRRLFCSTHNGPWKNFMQPEPQTARRRGIRATRKGTQAFAYRHRDDHRRINIR